MFDLFHGLAQKIAIALTLSLAGVSGLACQAPASNGTATSSVAVAAAPQTAIIASALAPIPAFSTAASTSASASLVASVSTSIATTTFFLPITMTAGTADVIPNLLPDVAVMKTSTKPSAALSQTPKQQVAVKAAVSQPSPQVSTSPTPITAQAFLDATTISLGQNLNGFERLTFITDGGEAGKISWNFADTTVGGIGSIPKFAVVYSCTPLPTNATPDDLNQNPLFAVRTSYACTVSLTPLSGTDRRTISKDFDFQTDPGQLVASVAPETDNLLQNNTNNGGFTFDNQDSKPVTITALTVDVSFTGVTASNLLVLRFADPITGASLFDDALGKTGGSQIGLSVPLSFTIPANSQKVLPVEAIGVSILAVDGTSPTINVTLRGVTVSDGIATKLISPQISWTCIVPIAAYDPYATSSPFLDGQACGN